MPDPSDGTHRLTLDQVEENVHCLPDDAIDILAQGPLPDRQPSEPEYWMGNCKDCRVCKALEELGKTSGPANALLEWHSFVGKSFEVLEAIAMDKGWDDEAGQLLQEQSLDLFGALAYSRCCVIYATARAEKLRREITTGCGRSLQS